MSVPSHLAFLIPDVRSIAYPPRSAWNHNFLLAYGVAKTPLGTHSSYLSRSRVRAQVMASYITAISLNFDVNDKSNKLFRIGYPI